VVAAKMGDYISLTSPNAVFQKSFIMRLIRKNNVCHLSPNSLFQNKCRRKTEGNWLIQVYLETTITVLWPLHRTTSISRNPQWRTGGFCWSKVLLLACPCWWQL